jgi:hypothetical protein
LPASSKRAPFQQRQKHRTQIARLGASLVGRGLFCTAAFFLRAAHLSLGTLQHVAASPAFRMRVLIQRLAQREIAVAAPHGDKRKSLNKWKKTLSSPKGRLFFCVTHPLSERALLRVI